MAAEASFTRTDTPDGARFDVVPARTPFSIGCLFIVFILFAYSLCSSFARSSNGSSYGYFPYVVVALALVYWLITKGPAPRRRVSILVNRDGIRVGERVYPAAEIQELWMGNPKDAGGSSSTVYASGAGGLGMAMGQELRERSYALMLRTRRSSKPEILAFGLTWNAGKALLNDVQEAMR